jgi:hypothetical protein
MTLQLHTKEIASMAGPWRILVGVVAVSLGVASSSQAQGFGGGCGWYAPPAVSYYYPAPVYYYYPRVIAIPDAPPTPAPPSSNAKTASERPVIITTRGLATDAAGTAAKVRLKIGFWNLTGRDITLTVAGQVRTLAKNRAVTLELEREFSWQIDRLPAHLERVPEGQAVHEVVIRE